MIVRLPFAVPSDPIFAAWRAIRQQLYAIRRARCDPALPPGFGRLIRTQTDRGVVALFDSRVITSATGRRFWIACQRARCGEVRWRIRAPGGAVDRRGSSVAGLRSQFFCCGSTLGSPF